MIYLLAKSQKPFFLCTHFPLGQFLWDRQVLYKKLYIHIFTLNHYNTQLLTRDLESPKKKLEVRGTDTDRRNIRSNFMIGVVSHWFLT